MFILENDKSEGSINTRKNYTNSAGLTKDPWFDPTFFMPIDCHIKIENIFTTSDTAEHTHHDVRSSGTEYYIRRRFSYRLRQITGTRAGAYTQSLHSLSVIT